MRIIPFFILSFILFCCNQQNRDEAQANTNSTKSNSSKIDFCGLSEVLFTEIEKFQKKYPVPKDTLRGIYVYDAIFYKNKLDTFLSLRQSAEGIHPVKELKVKWVYNCPTLSPTIIREFEYNYSINFIL